LIALELIWTRIFSAEFFYTFAFLVLSLAILGLGLGALAVRLFRVIDRDSLLGVFLSLTGLMTALGPILVFQLGVDFSQLFSSFPMIIKFAVTTILLSSAFGYGGIALAILFKRYHREMPRLYMYDLVGAGLGVAFAIIMMNTFGTPEAAFLSALPVLLAAFIVSQKWWKAIPVVIAAAAVALCPLADDLLRVEREERAPILYRHWDAMSLVKIFQHEGPYRGINVDNAANSSVYEFDGNWDRPDSMRFQFGIAVDYLIGLFDSCTFLSLGSGGGTDVLQALQEGATEIHAVDVNPHINDLMLDGELAGYTGNIYHDPRVIVATEDDRAYVRSFKNKFDLIYSLSSNTFAAVAS
jgi:predicted membrane-bound spermidine synthase